MTRDSEKGCSEKAMPHNAGKVGVIVKGLLDFTWQDNCWKGLVQDASGKFQALSVKQKSTYPQSSAGLGRNYIRFVTGWSVAH